MDYHPVEVPQSNANAVFEGDVFVDRLLQVRQVDRRALQRIVHFLGDAGEVGRALNDGPPGAEAALFISSISGLLATGPHPLRDADRRA